VSGPRAGTAIEAHDGNPLTVGSAEGNHLVLSDRSISRYHLELARSGDRVRISDLGSTNGTEIGGALFQNASALVTPPNSIKIGDSVLRVVDGGVVMVDTSAEEPLGLLRGRALATRQLFATIQNVAKSRVSVLLLGESGTGKELVARVIHQLGAASSPFATLDCGAMVPSLFASELFGHERGAFTGADRRHDGAFTRAHGGTLFLDEIGELPAELQASLLGVLERKSFRRLGGENELPCDVRIVSATHRDLRGEVNDSRFRLDLFYRLAVVTIRIPPLRERKGDIPILVEHFLREAGHVGAVEEVFSAAEMARLIEHHWPGNIRELRNVVEAATVVGAREATLEAVSTRAPGIARGQSPEPSAVGSLPYKEARRSLLDRFEREYISGLLARTGGNVRKAAREAGMDRSYLIDLVKRHGLG
jgi:DNA-binding NtrC family response regulator